MPKFSIIVPVYNVAPWLRECLDSVSAQSFTDWECLCVDDGSTDGSGAILDEYAAKDARFRVIHQENRGVSAARNAALERATGEWIGFLDGDDIYHPELLAACRAAIETFPSTDMVRFRYTEFNDGSACKWHLGHTDGQPVHYGGELSASLFDGGFSERIYRAEGVKGIRFKSYSYGEDLLWKTECVIRLNSLVSLEAALYGYRQRQGSATRASATLNGRLSSLHWRYDVWQLLRATAKTVDRECFRRAERALTEGYSVLYVTAPEAVRREIRPHWMEVLAVLGREGRSSPWLRYAARQVSLNQSTRRMIPFFYVPQRLKATASCFMNRLRRFYQWRMS